MNRPMESLQPSSEADEEQDTEIDYDPDYVVTFPELEEQRG